MLKHISTILCLIILSSNVSAVQIARPSFEEFCPAIYYHKEPLPEDWIEEAKYSKTKKALLWSSGLVYFPITFATYPFAISDSEWRRKQRSKKIRAAYNTTLKYWQEREQSFNDSLSLCESTKDVASCYIQVKINEEQKALSIERNRILKNIEKGLYGIQAQQSSTNFNLQQINNKL